MTRETSVDFHTPDACCLTLGKKSNRRCCKQFVDGKSLSELKVKGKLIQLEPGKGGIDLLRYHNSFCSVWRFISLRWMHELNVLRLRVLHRDRTQSNSKQRSEETFIVSFRLSFLTFLRRLHNQLLDLWDGKANRREIFRRQLLRGALRMSRKSQRGGLQYFEYFNFGIWRLECFPFH